MLTIIWLLLTLLLAVGQLLVIAQTDWLVHGPLHQGVYALCYHNKCQWRQFQHSNLAMGILLGFFLANLMLWVTLVLTMASMFRTACEKDREGCLRLGKVVDLAANAQFFSGLLTGVSLALMPFDMQEIFCTTNELLKSIANCRIGWAYAFACIMCMVGMCLPVLGKFVADQRKAIFYVIVSEDKQEGEQV